MLIECCTGGAKLPLALGVRSSLDRRVLDCLVGLEDESTEVAESASLYSPSVALEDVVSCNPMCLGLQPLVPKSATVGAQGCNPMYVSGAA